MSSRNAFSLAAAALVSTSACFAPIHGSGTSATETREHADFTHIDNRSSLLARVEVGSDFAVRVRCDDNLIEYVTTRVDGDALVILQENREVYLNPRTACAVEVELPALASLENSGSGGADVDGEVADLESIASSGSGEVAVRGIETESIDVEASGSGGVTLAGIATSVNVESSGSGGVDAAALVADEVSVDASGSGSVSVNADTKIDIVLSGSGGVTVEGNPTDRDVEDSGSGEVTFE